MTTPTPLPGSSQSLGGQPIPGSFAASGSSFGSPAAGSVGEGTAASAASGTASSTGSAFSGAAPAFSAAAPSSFAGSSTGFSSATSAAGAGSAGNSAIVPTSAPMPILYASLLASAAGIALAAVSSSLAAGIAAWVLGAFVALLLSFFFLNKDQARQANPWYQPTALARVFFPGSIVLAFVAVAVAAARIALIVGRM